MKRILIENAVIVNEGRKVPGSVVIEGEKIAEILVDRQELLCLVTKRLTRPAAIFCRELLTNTCISVIRD